MIRYECPRCGASMKLHRNSKGGYLLCSDENCKRLLLVIDYGTGKYEIIKGELPWCTNYPHRSVLRDFIEVGNTSRPLKNEKIVRQMSNQQGVSVNGF